MMICKKNYIKNYLTCISSVNQGKFFYMWTRNSWICAPLIGGNLCSVSLVWIALLSPSFSRSTTVFFFSKTGWHTKIKNPGLPYYLSIAKRGMTGYIPFPRELALSKMQTALFRIWNRIAESTSYEDNRYARSASNFVLYLMSEYYWQDQSVVVLPLCIQRVFSESLDMKLTDYNNYYFKRHKIWPQK